LGYLSKLFEMKRRVVEELSTIVGPNGAERARNDHHSKRHPRPCGITIHTGRGCTNACLYCYAIDMGFPRVDEPYNLKPEELVLALAMNPFVVPKRTFAAFGSVVEPFLPNTASYTVKCIELVAKYLRLPCQVSTKMFLSSEVLRKLCEAEQKLNLLVTIVTWTYAKVLEPRASSPHQRIETLRMATSMGMRTTLFMRPIIPGVTDREAYAILKACSDAGVETVVLGSLRVTPGILERLARAGIDVSEIERRLPRKPRSVRDQVTIREGDLKRRIASIARDLGLKVFESACQANVWSHGEYCAACDFGPCGDYSSEPRIGENDVEELLELMGVKARCELIDRTRVLIRGSIPRDSLEILRQATRRVIIVEKGFLGRGK